MPPELTIAQILAWADEHFRRKARWPKITGAPVLGGPLGENWRRIDNALRYGLRGLPGGSSVAQLLDECRQVRNIARLPQLNDKKILAWADAHHRRTGEWPNLTSGEVRNTRGELWSNINAALRDGGRGLPGGTTLARLLEGHRGVPHRLHVVRLTLKHVLAWADEYHRRNGRWPKRASIVVPDAPRETWRRIDDALQAGTRGWGGKKSSLAQVLAKYRGVRNTANLPPLAIERILQWADEFHARTHRWPNQNSGQIPGSGGETWKAVELALFQGLRGLPGGCTLARLFHEKRAVRNRTLIPTLTVKQILSWADAHRERTGDWPRAKSGCIPGSEGESWAGVEYALQTWSRGLRTSRSLHRLLVRHRKKRRNYRCSAFH